MELANAIGTSTHDTNTTSNASKNNLSPSVEDKEIYKMVFDTRNFEINLFWQRSNYFLVLNSALAIGFFNLKTQEYAFVLAIFGLFASFLWFRVTLGSKYWQTRWEQRLKIIEQRIAPDLDLFSANWSTINADVQASIQDNQPRGWLKSWLEDQVLRKHSVSYNMMLLSLLFLAGWVALAFARIISGGPLVG